MLLINDSVTVMWLKINCVVFIVMGVVCNLSKYSVFFLLSMVVYGLLLWLVEMVLRIKLSEFAAFFIVSAFDDAMKCFVLVVLVLVFLVFV